MENQTAQNRTERNVPKALILMIVLGVYVSVQL
jgi:hypothetical protein